MESERCRCAGTLETLDSKRAKTRLVVQGRLLQARDTLLDLDDEDETMANSN